jgi:2,5-diketo-D-gluconate reductase B
MECKIPLIGLGTWNLRGKECEEMVQTAWELGYRHIDTAFNYGNQESSGRAIRSLPKKDLFITSKVMLDQGSPEAICHQSLKELGIDCLDLYLVHWPDRAFPISQTLASLEKLVQEGKILSYGVSNYTIHHLKDWLALGAKIACNQVEFHPYLYQKDLWQFSQKQGITLTAYRPLGKGALLEEAQVQEIAKTYSKTPSQILLRWLFQKKIPWIAKGSSKKHLQENFEMIDFSLNEKDMFLLDSLNRNKRFCNQSWSDFEY